MIAVLVAAAALVAVRLLAPRLSRGYHDAHGLSIVHYELQSRLLGRSLEEVAIVPPGGGRRPLLVLLHGRHDPHPGPIRWLVPELSGPETMLNDELLAAIARLGRRAPVVVLLNGGAHSYYHDRRAGRWASMLLREALPDAARRFGTLPGRVAIGGISMGGYGALLLAGAAAPGRFCAVGGHSAAVWQRPGDSAPGAFDDAEDWTRNDVYALASAGRYDRLPVWLDVGTDDPFRAADTALARKLRARRGTRVTFHVWPGGHEGAYWHRHMRAYLRFYADALARCTST